VVIAFSVATLVMATPAAAMPKYGEWSEGTFLSAVNTTEFEFANAISKDGLRFYFQRGDASVNGENIWVTHRATTDGAWQAPEQLSGNVNSSFNDRAAYVSQDGHCSTSRAIVQAGAAGSISWCRGAHMCMTSQPGVRL